MKLKHGKKYETADGVVYRVVKMGTPISGLTFESSNCVYNDFGEAVGIEPKNNLIRRHYTKHKPAHKLDLKPGDVVKLVIWEDWRHGCGTGSTFNVGSNGPESDDWDFNQPKGQRPLFLVMSRVSWTKQPS